MTNPKEKAKELVDKFEDYSMHDVYEEPLIEIQKQCALIALDEILHAMDKLLASDLNNDFDVLANKSYWMDVRKEIEKL